MGTQPKHTMLAAQRNPRRNLAEELISRGVRMTHQRRILVDLIQRADRHLDVLTLWRRARSRDSTLNKVTVYRTLSLL
ncbi:MAG: transcriptional repressor, partial [Acidobacteriota bacterium]